MFAWMLSRTVRVSIELLTTWCQYCDHQLEDASKRNRSLALSAVENLHLRLNQEPDPTDFPFYCLRLVQKQFRIPERYARDHLEGMRLDVVNARYETFSELREYCYFASGSVGLMVAQILRVSDAKALEHAFEVAFGLHLIEIATHVYEDSKKGRLYLPLAWLRHKGLPVQAHEIQGLIENGTNEQKRQILDVAEYLVEEAEVLFRSARRGFDYLSFSSAYFVSQRMDQAVWIGRALSKRGHHDWTSAIQMPFASVFLQEITRILRMIPFGLWRAFHRHRPVSVSTPWAFKP